MFDRGHYLLAIDGISYFCSTKVGCPQCLERKLSNGTIQYHHQAVAAVLTHPETGEVLPIAIEAIVKQDGETKNDCERNTTKRLFRGVLKKLKTRRDLWGHLRSHARHFDFASFADLWAAVLSGAGKSQRPPARYA